ncbi:endonuclease/exonuclease/phosphatase [bacterium]|nr:endonuclease/exonuclease/phosphatase [bacterium]
MIRTVVPFLFALSAWLTVSVPLAAQPSAGESFRVVGWNLESGESDDDFLAAQVAKKKGVTVWGFSEVAGQKTLDTLVNAANKAGGKYAGVLGTTGGGDRLAIMFDTSRLTLASVEELKLIQLGSKNQRAPLVGHFKGKTTGKEFLFVVNHLSRDTSSPPKRVQQAKMLNAWVKDVPAKLPVVMVGDFNLDFHVTQGDAGKRDPGFDELTRDNRFVWARPAKLIKTNTASFNTVLDFVFVGNAPAGWSFDARILNREDDKEATSNKNFKDSKQATDHRPVDAVFTFSAATPGPAGGFPLAIPAVRDTTGKADDPAAIRREIEALRQRLRELEERLNPQE